MKKKLLFTITALLLLTMICMTACEKSEFGMTENTEKYMQMTAKNADKDAFFMVGSLEVGEGEAIEVDSNIESGSIDVEFILSSGEQSVEELPEMDVEPVFIVKADKSTDKASAGVEPGSYMVKATCTEKATGTIDINVIKSEKEQWKDAASTDEAGEMAGVGLFLTDPSGTSLGPVLSADYRYMEGVAEAHYGIAAVEVFVRKGLSSIDEGDISFDHNDYAHEWTQTIGDREVKCFGNREGEATKTIWTEGEYSYAVLAYGAGGDENFGLSAEDLAAMVNDIQ